ncbi:MAG: DUF87 domain-containing protein [Desulfobacteraceae bacterium]|nr:MAG: DUF87 domain-containing protein [Desulfobacteraceae bacterium]
MISFGMPLKARDGLPDIDDKDMYKHVAIVGGTGQGKTTKLLHLISKVNGAKIILDPNGALAEMVYAMHPDAIYVNKHNPVSLNPLTREHLSKSEMANELVEVLNTASRVTSKDQVEVSVLMAKIIRNAVRIGIKDLGGLSEFLEYEELRKKVNDKYWKAFDEKDSKGWYVNREQRESAKRISARLSMLVDDEHILPFIQGNNFFAVEQLVEKGKVVIFDFRGFDDFLTAFLGGLISIYVKSYYLHVATQESKPLFFFVDEVDLFFSSLFSRFLAEARKYNIGVIMSMHSYSQIPKDLESMIEANCYTKIILQDKHKAEVHIGQKSHLVLCDPPPEITPKNPPTFSFLRDDWCMI